MRIISHQLNEKYFFLFTSAFSQNEKIKVFINCRCDDDFLKQNTLFFDYVRDRTLSDIEIFVFEITNASGGRNYSFNYNGKNDFLNKSFLYVQEYYVYRFSLVLKV